MTKALRNSIASLLLLAAGGAAADVIPVTPTNPSVLVNSVAMPTFNVGFTAPYDLVSLDFTLGYKHAALTFQQLEFTLPSTGGNVSFLVGSSPLPTSGNSGGFDYNASLTVDSFDSTTSLLTFTSSTLGSLALSGPVLIKASFLAGPSPSATSVALMDAVAGKDGSLDLDTFSSSATVTVSAIPEPGGWLMMLAGLGLVATLGRRRLVARA